MKKLILFAAITLSSFSAFAQGTAFTYQGRLNDGASPASGGYDLTFAVFDADSIGSQVGATLTNSAVAVSNGLFTVTLDFGAGIFPGNPRWLEIGVATNGSGSFDTLSPRQALLPTPYAMFAGNSANVASGAVVKSLNSLRDDVTLAPGANVTLTPNGNTLTIDAATGGGSSIWSLLNNNAYYLAGNVGIGTNAPTPGISLEVRGATRLTTGGSGGNVQFGTPSGETGMTIIGANRADLRFDGSTIKLLANAGTGVPPNANGITIDTLGNVGVGKNINFGSTTRQMLNMFGTGFGVGVQTADLYYRSGGGFAWHVGGAHNDATYNSGGGTTVATLDLTTGLDFGSRLGQHLSLWGGVGSRRFDIGMQVSTIYFRTGNGVGDAFAWYKGGAHSDGQRNAGGGQSLMTLDGETGLYVAGPASVCTLTIRGGCDLAEPFPMKEAEIEKGSVVVIDDEHPGQLKLSKEAYDTRVAGIISGAKGISAGIAMHQEGAMEGGQNVALSGRVYAKADATFGAIKPGDLLTTSSTPGHAMKVTDHAKAQGASLGKAMSSLNAGKGMVLVLVTLQ